MPIVSEAQRRAMWAAKEGHSTLGIPKEVGEKFIAHDFASLAANAAIPGNLRKLAVDADTAMDMEESDWRGLIDGLVKFFLEEAREPEHAHDAGPEKNDRAIFEYMEPPKNASPEMRDQHAQCHACRMLVPQSAMPAEGKHKKGCDLCVVLGSQEAVDGGKDRGSCGEFASWPTPDATPDQAVVQEHAEKLAEGAPGSATKEEVGYVERAVRCENCFYGGKPKCGWYEELNEKLGGYFHEDRPIEPKACCNSQTAKPDAEVAEDAAMAMDRSFAPDSDSRFEIAMDRDSVREKTPEGRLIVKRTAVCKACVSPYRGKEIPGWKDLGLDPDHIYNLLRAPEEIEKGAATSNGVQLLIKHRPVSARDHAPGITVGSLGSDAEWDGEYLYNSLYVNAQEAIDAIESNRQRELSPGYRYKPDMTPGNFRGTAYDGVMRDISFNHVALVEDGRQGPDVVVQDEALKENDMTKATRFGVRTLHMTAAAIAPLLAMDSKVTLQPSLFRELTTKNFGAHRAKLLSTVRTALEGKLRPGIAMDGSIEKFGKALDAFIDDVNSGMDEPAPEEANAQIEKPMEIESAPAGAAKGISEEGSTYDAEPLKAFLREKGMGEDDIAKCMDMMPKNGLAKDEKKEDEKDEDMVDKPAMDAALKAQSEAFEKRIKEVRASEQGVRRALGEVKPYVGELPADMAFDSAADVYRHALVMKNVDGAKTMHADALLPVLKTLPKIGARPAAEVTSHTTIAMDSVEKARKLAPGLEHISTN